MTPAERKEAWRVSVERAKKDLAAMTACQINVRTAFDWAARALVAYDYANRSDAMRTHWLREADTFAAEAAEHAGVAELEGCKGIAAEILNALVEAKKEVG